MTQVEVLFDNVLNVVVLNFGRGKEANAFAPRKCNSIQYNIDKK